MGQVFIRGEAPSSEGHPIEITIDAPTVPSTFWHSFVIEAGIRFLLENADLQKRMSQENCLQRIS
jgi:hypothetical protein